MHIANAEEVFKDNEPVNIEDTKPENRFILTGSKPIPEILAYEASVLVNSKDKNPSDIHNELVARFKTV